MGYGMALEKSDVSEKELELIEKVAKKIVDLELEGPVIMLLQTLKPVAWLSGELAYFYFAPFLPLLDNRGYDFIDTFEKRENVERLMKRVEKLYKEKTKEKKKNQGQSWLSRLRKKLFPG